MKELLLALVDNLLDDEWGINEQAYRTLLALVEDVLGAEAANQLQRRTDATDGRFYYR